jgi:hypothetical protein
MQEKDVTRKLQEINRLKKAIGDTYGSSPTSIQVKELRYYCYFMHLHLNHQALITKSSASCVISSSL